MSSLWGTRLCMANDVALATAAERLERLDSSVPVADEIGNAVLTDNRQIMRLTAATP